jgi:hypothetical protein
VDTLLLSGLLKPIIRSSLPLQGRPLCSSELCSSHCAEQAGEATYKVYDLIQHPPSISGVCL